MKRYYKTISSSRRFLSAASLMLVLVVSTSAYTVVMRGGKRIEIPAQFTVTSTTLTYETAPGFLVTIQMAAIDVPATERANNEGPGSMFDRLVTQEERITNSPSDVRAVRTVTNQQLEGYARVRQNSDRAYEQRRKELGLPPSAVERAQNAAADESFLQELIRTRAEEDRTADLESQIAELSAQLNYMQGRLAAVSSEPTDSYNNFNGVLPVSPFDNFGTFGRSRVNPALLRTPWGVPIGGAFGVFNVPTGINRFHRGNVFVAPGAVLHRRGYGHRIFPGNTFFGARRRNHAVRPR